MEPSEARVQTVADALENSDKQEFGYAEMSRALYVRLARAAIAASDATLEVANEMVMAAYEAWYSDAYDGSGYAKEQFHDMRDVLKAAFAAMKEGKK